MLQFDYNLPYKSSYLAARINVSRYAFLNSEEKNIFFDVHTE